MTDLPQLTPQNTNSILIAQNGNVSFQKVNTSFLTANTFKNGEAIQIAYNSAGLNPLASLSVVSTVFVSDDMITRSTFDSAVIQFPSITSASPTNVSINGPITSYVLDTTLNEATNTYPKLYKLENAVISNTDVLKPTKQEIKVVFTINEHNTVFTHDYTTENIIHNFYPMGVKGLYEVAFNTNNEVIGYNTRTVSVGRRPHKIRDLLSMIGIGHRNIIPVLTRVEPNDNTKSKIKLEIVNNHNMFLLGYRSKPDYTQKLFPTQGTPVLYTKVIPFYKEGYSTRADVNGVVDLAGQSLANSGFRHALVYAPIYIAPISTTYNKPVEIKFVVGLAQPIRLSDSTPTKQEIEKAKQEAIRIVTDTVNRNPANTLIGVLITQTQHLKNPITNLYDNIEFVYTPFGVSSGVYHQDILEPATISDRSQTVAVDSNQKLAPAGIGTIDSRLSGAIYGKNGGIETLEAKYKTWRLKVKNDVATLDGKPYTGANFPTFVTDNHRGVTISNIDVDILQNKDSNIDDTRTQILNVHFGFRDKRPGKSLNISFDSYNSQIQNYDSSQGDYIGTGDFIFGKDSNNPVYHLVFTGILSTNVKYTNQNGTLAVNIYSTQDVAPYIRDYEKQFKQGQYLQTIDFPLKAMGGYQSLQQINNLQLLIRFLASVFPIFQRNTPQNIRNEILSSPIFGFDNRIDQYRLFMLTAMGVLYEIDPVKFNSFVTSPSVSSWTAKSININTNNIFTSDIFNNIDFEYEILFRNIT